MDWGGVDYLWIIVICKYCQMHEMTGNAETLNGELVQHCS